MRDGGRCREKSLPITSDAVEISEEVPSGTVVALSFFIPTPNTRCLEIVSTAMGRTMALETSHVLAGTENLVALEPE